MKKILAAFLLMSVLLSFCACNTNTANPENISASSDEIGTSALSERETLSSESASISSETQGIFTEPETIPADSLKVEDLAGRWYGPDNSPVIDIHKDSTGTVKIGDDTYKAKFAVDKGVFSVSSEGYEISGKLCFTGSLMEVEILCGNKSYTVAFSNETAVKPLNSYFYSIGGRKYEYNPDAGTISESSFPVDKNAESKKVYVVLEKAPEGSEPENYLVFRFYEAPPENYGKPDSSIKNAKENDIPIPSKLDLCTADARILADNKIYGAVASLDIITITWTTDVNEDYEYFFGNLDHSDRIEYTFNEDGTGNVRINDTLGYLRYTYENGIIDLSVTIGDKTETNKGQAIRIGDVLYLENADGKPISMAWVNPAATGETTAASAAEEQ